MYLKEHKGWEKLSVLNLNHTGLTDIALDHIVNASMPKLLILNIRYNRFTEKGKAIINTLKMNHIHVNYRITAIINEEFEM